MYERSSKPLFWKCSRYFSILMYLREEEERGEELGTHLSHSCRLLLSFSLLFRVGYS